MNRLNAGGSLLLIPKKRERLFKGQKDLSRFHVPDQHKIKVHKKELLLREKATAEMPA